MKKLPIGIQSFEEIRNRNCYYADKTPLIQYLSENGKYYFLPVPVGLGRVYF